MPYLRVSAAGRHTDWYVPEWKARRIDLPTVAQLALVEDQDVTRVDILSDVHEVQQTILREGADPSLTRGAPTCDDYFRSQLCQRINTP